jgi:phage/plasmid-associated DNA primase
VLELNKFVDLETVMEVAFRPRVKTDYMTNCNPYDFAIPNKKTIDEIELLYKKIQPEKECYEYFLTFMAYCLTGNTNEQVCEFDVGYTASNGKSTHLSIHQSAMPFYTHKLGKNTFDEGYSKFHKQIIKIFENPIRLAYMEEINTKRADAEVLKDFVDGEAITFEILYGTTSTRQPQAKLKACGNHDVNIDGDKGILRRGIKLEFNSEFTDKVEQDDWKRSMFVLDNTLTRKFKDDEYKCGYVCMLLPFVKKYLKNGLHVPKTLKDDFKDMVEQFDTLKLWMNDNIEICDADEVEPDHRISKTDLLAKVEFGGLRNGWKSILPKMKQLGLRYNRTLNCGRTPDGKKVQGGFEGCRWVAE